eukprot:SM000144S00684  [mRNA]  locus=s144:340044:343835:+ [translate_table: standard]
MFSMPGLGQDAGCRLSLFELGIGPSIWASIVMKAASTVLPELKAMQKKGLEGQAQLKRLTWRVALFVAVVESAWLAFSNRQYAVHAATSRWRYFAVTMSLATLGAMVLNWISERMTEDGFGEGTSILICVDILLGYMQSLRILLANFQTAGAAAAVRSAGLAGWVAVMTVGAAYLTLGLRRVPLQYYEFELAAPGSSSQQPVVEPYIPLTIIPQGMMPVLSAQMVLNVPNILARSTLVQASCTCLAMKLGKGPSKNLTDALELSNRSLLSQVVCQKHQYNPTSRHCKTAVIGTDLLLCALRSILGTPFWVRLQALLSPAGAGTTIIAPLAHYAVLFALIVVFNCWDPSDPAKDWSEWLSKIGARIPGVKPGLRTVEHLRSLRSSTTLCGGVLLALLTCASGAVDQHARATNPGGSGSIGFTSMLIIMGSIISLRRTVLAYQQLPRLEKVLRRQGAA